MAKKRIQLTLFVDENNSEPIEKIRKEFNPEQYELIKSHVTLCREHELEQIDIILQTLSELNHSYITIDFGPVKRFASEKGVLIPAKISNPQFEKLRRIILKHVYANPEKQDPHITLMHPGNSTCTDPIFKEIENLKIPDKLKFKKISLIEQEEGKKWTILKEFDLKKHS